MFSIVEIEIIGDASFDDAIHRKIRDTNEQSGSDRIAKPRLLIAGGAYVSN